MSLSEKDLPRFFKPAFIRRGQEYFKNKKVIRLNTYNDDQLIRASVNGSGSHPYQVQIRLKQENGIIEEIKGRCSCPVQFNCKHVVASLLFWMDQQTLKQGSRFGMPSDKWLYQSKAVKPGPPTLTRCSSELILYTLELKQKASRWELYVKPVKTRILKDGQFSKATLYNGNPESRAGYMRDDDRFTLLLLNSLKRRNTSSVSVLEGEPGTKALNVLIDTKRCHWRDETFPALKHAEKICSSIAWGMKPDASQKIEVVALNPDYVVLPLIPPHYLNTKTGECGVLDIDLPAEVAAVILSLPVVKIDDVCKIQQYLTETFAEYNLPLPIKPPVREVDAAKPLPCLQLLNEDDDDAFFSQHYQASGIARLHFEYGNISVHPLSSETKFIRHTDDGFELIHRNHHFEKEALQRLDNAGLIFDDFYPQMEDELLLEPVHIQQTWLDFMLNQKPALEADGWQVKIAEDFVFQVDEVDQWYADIDEVSNDWFQLEVGIEVEGRAVNLLPFLVNYLETKTVAELQNLPDQYPLLFRQDNGRMLHIPLVKVRHIIDTLVELYDPAALDGDGRLLFSRYHSRQIKSLDSEHTPLRWAGGEQVRKLGDRLLKFKGIQHVDPPETLKTTLRDYQLEGLCWLQFLREYDLGGILADDMGLGKTVQTLAHLLIEKKAGRDDLPNLVIAPTSLMVNWKRECNRFAPDLSILVLHGPDRRQKFSSIARYDLVLTTYPLLSRDSDALLQQCWHSVILDEAQYIKNPKSRAAQTAQQLKSRHRLCLTGTPMENHLGELWSQFHFLMPGLLGGEKKFRQLFQVPIEKHKNAYRKQQLLSRIAPFLLRRDKANVARELPPKTVIVSEVELHGPQRDLYEAIRISMHDKVRRVIDSQGVSRSQIIILDALLKLRQVCCHPQLLSIPSAQKVKQSAKLNQLMEMLPEMVDEGRRILLFSQFTSMLALIEEAVVKSKIDYVKLTGQTRDREKPVDAFQSGKVPLFLISLKAGGAGLNLTAADTVIHYDPWWNPASEQQATDRAHRIGQDKPVFVYKLITANSVEEKILHMQHRKQALADTLYAERKGGSGISHEDLQALFEPLV